MSVRKPASHSIVRMFAVIVVAATLVAIVTRNTLVQVADRANIAIPVEIWPPDSDQILLRAASNVVLTDWIKSEPREVASVAQQIRRTDPLDEWPFVLQGALVQQQGNIAQSIPFLEAAKRRQPRSLTARVLLIQSLAGIRDFDRTMGEIVSAAQMEPDRTELIDVLLSMDDYPEMREQMIASVKNVPTMQRKLLLAASARTDKKSLVSDLLPGAEINRMQRWQIIANLGADGNYKLADRIWRAGGGGLQPDMLVFDADFDGLDGPPPFAWQRKQSGDLETSFLHANGGKGNSLHVEYFGTTPRESVEQTLLLKPGHYEVSAVGRSLEPETGLGEMRWTIACVGSDQPLGTLVFKASTTGQQQQATSFAVTGSDCQAQKLVLTAMQSPNREPYRFEFYSIDIRKIAA